MFYENRPENQKEEYKQMLGIVGSLSRVFSESDVPYLYYRAHENIFAKYFNLVNNSRHDNSADAYSLELRLGVGLKTWVGGDNQKVAEFGRLRPHYEHLSGMELVKTIAEYRNERIRTTKNLHGLDDMVYHIVKRVPGAMKIYEAAFDYIDIDNISLILDRGTVNSVYFTDGKHTYHFSLSKNTLYMNFDDMELLDEFDVDILEDPYEMLAQIATPHTPEPVTPGAVAEVIEYVPEEREQLCLRLYSTKFDGRKFVAEHSGLNQWNGARTVYRTDEETGERRLVDQLQRNPNELYIPYPAVDRARGVFFPPRDHPFELKLPDGSSISAKVCQQDSKAIMSNPNSDLGKWLLRDVFELEEGTMVTYEMLQVFGIDSVMFTKEDEDVYSVDFCELGTYERFYGIEDPDAELDAEEDE